MILKSSKSILPVKVQTEVSVVIPDIHGSKDALDSSLDTVSSFVSENNLLISDLIFLGDYIDRGVDSYEVLESLNELKNRYQVVTLMGNHEAIMLRALITKDFSDFTMWILNGGLKTFKSFVINIAPEFMNLVTKMEKIFRRGFKSSSREEFFDFFTDNFAAISTVFEIILNSAVFTNLIEGMKLTHFSDGNLYVHGGIDVNFIESREYNVSSWLEELNSEFSIALDNALNGDFALFNNFDTASKFSGGTQNASPFWFRRKDFNALDDVELLITEDYLAVAGVERMIVGHSVVDEVRRFVFPSGISVWFTDVGMSSHYDTFFEEGGLIVPKTLENTKTKSFEDESYFLDSFGFVSNLSNVVALEKK